MAGPKGPLYLKQEVVDEEVVYHPAFVAGCRKSFVRYHAWKELAFPSRYHCYKLLWGLKSWTLATENGAMRMWCLGLGYSTEKSCREHYEVLLLVLLDVVHGAQSTRVLSIPGTSGDCDISAEDYMKAAKLNMLPVASVES